MTSSMKELWIASRRGESSEVHRALEGFRVEYEKVEGEAAGAEKCGSPGNLMDGKR